VELRARKLAILAKASNEILADGLRFDAQISNALVEATAWNLDRAFLTGTGAGCPRGVLNDPALIVVDPEEGQDADTIIYANLVEMLARLHPRCVPNSVWLFNTDAIPNLLTLSIDLGIAGQHIPVMSQSNGQFTILTRPVLFSEKLPVLGDEGDALLVDFSQYGIGLRRDLVLERSGHVYFTTDELAFRGIVRIDGSGLWSGPYTPLNGSSLSWCVTLGAR
jgi:HK97 family phage major capsid protein